MRFLVFIVLFTTLCLCPSVYAEAAPEELKCGDVLVGQDCSTYGRKGVCKETKCCRSEPGKPTGQPKCSPCARCVVTGLSKAQLKPKYSKLLRINELQKRAAATASGQERGKSQTARNGSKRAEGTESKASSSHSSRTLLTYVRVKVAKMKSRVPTPSTPIPPILNWAASVLMIALGAWGAWLSLTKDPNG